MLAIRSIVSQGLRQSASGRSVLLKGSPRSTESPLVASVARLSTIVATKDAERAQKIQELSLRENCLLVDVDDNPLGFASKRDCHQVGDNGSLLLHRAFSVFLFNTKGEMLLQRRSSHKVTFPDLYTNSCCSHPLYDFPAETVAENGEGVKVAAQRRLHIELGIPFEQCKPEEYTYLTRLIYKCPGDGVWGEHELDYILFLIKDVDIHPNPDEVREIRWLKRSELDDVMANSPITPWFKIISEAFLKKWWDNLDNLKALQDHKTIHKF